MAVPSVAATGTAAPPPHLVLVPFPAQGHVAPLLQLARLLHARGAHITFVHTHFNYRRLVLAKGEPAVLPSAATSPSFRVEVIDDGIPLSSPQHDTAALVDALRRNCPAPFRALLARLAAEAETDGGAPPVTCVVADVVMPFAPAVARELGVPEVQFFTASACGLMGYLHYGELIRRGLVPLKDESCFTNGYLDTPLEWVPAMKHMRLRDMPAFCHTTDPDDVMVAVTQHEYMASAAASSAIILNTLYELEKDVVDALAAFLPPIYTVGPLASVLSSSSSTPPPAMDISIWKEDTRCLPWLDGKPASSVVYVNFGSVAVMTAAQTLELAVGLARCGSPFLWVRRPDVVVDGGELPEEALHDVVARSGGMVVPWCPQAAVLGHAAVGLFVSHCGWNSMLEAVAAGKPVLGWPIKAEQTTNCRQLCEVWGHGARLPEKVESGAIAGMVKEMMGGELGKEKRAKAAEWKKAVEAAAMEGGSSWRNVERLLDDVLLVASK
ncbi:hypothetical protein HU200_061257 [Digitaria exilis]|uniref:Glycosyltransferase n=1 Tax=Digitaria exilis TaxID=1010633 RepID=A0A835AHN2_9POAL|nr:hypothetical protein HU200_061257 [Digitaria exilis]CAB3456355.1 unnamed protein product [Digitaria exilis]